MTTDLLRLKNRLKELSLDDLESILYRNTDSYGFLLPTQMLILGVEVPVPLTVSDFLDFFHYTRLKL
jgi:hypothetical protein